MAYKNLSVLYKILAECIYDENGVKFLCAIDPCYFRMKANVKVWVIRIYSKANKRPLHEYCIITPTQWP